MTPPVEEPQRAVEAPQRAHKPADAGRGIARLAGVAPVAVAAALVVALALHFITRSDLWFDEALTVNIARLPLSELGDALRQDGAPPLYYVLLHFWINVFGHGDVAVRALSGVIAVASLPLAYLAGRRVGGRVAAWAAVLILVSSPYAIRYSTETRMYALVMFLVLWGYLAVRRALEAPTWQRLAVVALVTALLAYSQYWSFYLVGTVGLGLVIAWWRGPFEGRRASRNVLAAMVVGMLALLPWLDTLLYQLSHTGTPWGDPVVPWYGVAFAMSAFAGGSQHAEAWPLLLVLLVLPFLALMGLAIDHRRIELDLHTRPAVRWEGATALGALVVGLAAAWVGGTAFDGRYASIVFPLLVIVLASSLTVFASARVRAGLLVFLVAFGLLGGLRNVDDQRTQAGSIADVIRAESHPGDVVVYCPDQLGPDTSRLLQGVPGLHQETFPDGLAPTLVNWVDYRQRVQGRDPAVFAARVLASTDPSAAIWFVNSSSYRYVDARCAAIGGAFGADRPTAIRILPDEDVYEHMGLTQYRGR